VLPHRQADPLGIQVQLIHQKLIGMAGANAIAREGLLWEIIQVEGDDQIGSTSASRTWAFISERVRSSCALERSGRFRSTALIHSS